MNKDAICNAFCGQIVVHDVPAGLAVKTPFLLQDGDPLGFYIVPTLESGKYRLEDSGTLVPFLEANGANLEHGTRAKEFRALLDEYGADFDSDSMEIHSTSLEASDVPDAAVQFVALLLRVQDLNLLRAEVVENTFRDDAKAAIAKMLEGLADVEFDAIPAPELSDYTADVLLRAKHSGATAAVYLGTSDAKASEAVSAWLEAKLKHSKVKVSMLCETEKPGIGLKLMRRAMNRLDSVSFFRDDEVASIEKLARQIGIDNLNGPTLHH